MPKKLIEFFFDYSFYGHCLSISYFSVESYCHLLSCAVINQNDHAVLRKFVHSRFDSCVNSMNLKSFSWYSIFFWLVNSINASTYWDETERYINSNTFKVLYWSFWYWHKQILSQSLYWNWPLQTNAVRTAPFASNAFQVSISWEWRFIINHLDIDLQTVQFAKPSDKSTKQWFQ